ncbi:hypothetical protein QO010_001420 [Caulobacter ginsengisoli]|uniref:Dipeptidyl-peptidase n=1 Tax=Caulobacter ginsengisoli TaxID=400775 RepID=A0ABU0IRL3_9CAUL|nr:S46 family peptidase [Caulobacter ginsengisoli]MDQ0463649.1 hypothetical protein [Caulobacter ginsengisoli]
MTVFRTFAGAVLAALFATAAVAPAWADEGMWTFDNFPAAKVQSDYGVKIDKPWLDRVQAAAVRIPGCSASLVSKAGLVLTNNHCVVDCTKALSKAGQDYVKDGFLTDARSDEGKCPGMTAEVLISITDVTGQIKAAGEGKVGAAYVQAKEAAQAVAEKTICNDVPGRRCQTISFYRGGQYKVYMYRRYTDVRLVFAPEFDIAFFGGDPDNFNFPRFDLDSAFLRLYDGDKPAATPQFLKWNPNAPAEGSMTFVAGNPGSTDRLLTVSQLETLRDLGIPIGQLQRSELRGRLIQFGEQGPEQKRIANEPLFGLENSFKVYFGRQMVLNDKAFMDAKRAAEAELRAKVAADPKLSAEIGDPWADIAAAQKAYADNFLVYRQLESEAGRGSRLFGWARTLVRAGQERAKPDAERMSDYAEVRLPLEAKRLLDPRPVDPQIETLQMEHWLLKTREYLTVDAPAVKTILGKDSPDALAARLVAGSKLADPAVRKALWDGGLAAVMASDDPMIQFVLKTDPDARAVRTIWESSVSGPTDRAAGKIAQARFAVYGESVYPDATFSLRLSYGKVAGWSYRGADVPAFTRIGGLWDRATGQEPFALPQRWIDAKDKLNPDTVFDFVSTNDIIGGNSGSPVINAKGEVIGAAFDGNIHSLGGAYGYDGRVNRTVVVSTAAITEALTKVYGRTALVQELLGK